MVKTFASELDDSPGYVYEKVADHIERRILAGDLAPGTLLPPERQLAVQYGVSLGTGRHATRVLRDRGLVVTVRSLGTFVRPAAAWPDAFQPSPGDVSSGHVVQLPQQYFGRA